MMSYHSSNRTRNLNNGNRRRTTAAARAESLESRRLLAAEIAVFSEFGPAVADNDNAPSESDGTNLGTAFVGGQRPFHTFQVTNTSPTDNLQLGGVSVPAGFALEKDLPATLAPGTSGFFTISLLDTEQATRSGTVQFATNVPGVETFDFAVTGTLAPGEVPGDNDFEDVPSFVDQDVVQREQGASDDGVPFNAVTNQLLRFSIPAGQAATRFAMETARTSLGGTGDAELLVLRDADDDGLLDLNELAQPVATATATAANPSVEQSATLSAGRYFGLLRVANFAFEDPGLPQAGVSINYTLSTTIDAVLPADVTVSVGDAIIGDGDITPSGVDGTDFGTAAVGEPAPEQTFTVTNTGDEPLTLGAVSATGGFEVVFGLPASLAAGESASFTLRMPTAAAGTRAGEVSFATGIPAKNPYNFAIAGVVTGNTPEIAVALDGAGALADGQAQAVDFGTVVAGQPAGVARTFVVTNVGGAPLTLGAVTLPAGYELTEPLATSLAPDASDAFTVTLTGVGDAGPRTGTMSVATGDADENPFDVPLAGTVAAVSTTPGPEISVTLGDGQAAPLSDGQAAPVEFGSSVLGGPGASRTFIVRNDGTAPLELATITVPAGFVVTEPLATTLAAGGFDAFTVAVSTVTAGPRSGAVAIGSNDADENPFEFNVSGTVGAAGAAGADVAVLLDGALLTSGQAVDFGDAEVGAAAPERTLTIRNDGDAALTLGEVEVPAGYTLVQGPAATVLAPDASTTVRIALNTAAAGTFNGQASVANSDADENPFLLTLTGTVGGPAVPPVVTVENVTARVPGTVIAGDRKARGTVAFRVMNASSTVAFAGPVTFLVAASSDNLPSSSDAQLLSVTRNVKLKAGASRPVKLKVTFPATVPDGSRTLIVSATAAGATDSGAGPAVSVQEPFVQLVGLPSASPLARPAAFGKPVRLSVPLQNAGNVPTTKTPAAFNLIVSTDGTDAGRVFETPATGRVSVKPGQSRPQRLTVTFPPGSFAPGSYQLIVRLVSAELNQTNGQTVALIPFTIA